MKTLQLTRCSRLRIWSDRVREDNSVPPRCLTEPARGTSACCRDNTEALTSTGRQLTTICADLEALNVVDHDPAHDDTLSISCCRLQHNGKSAPLQEVLKISVSSAKSAQSFDTAVGKSRKYRINRRGPSTEPCGTPDVIGSREEKNTIHSGRDTPVLQV